MPEGNGQNVQRMVTFLHVQRAEYQDQGRAWGREEPIWVECGLSASDGEKLSIFLKPDGSFEIERHFQYQEEQKTVAKGKLRQRDRGRG